jgi:hypothetical protein
VTRRRVGLRSSRTPSSRASSGSQFPSKSQLASYLAPHTTVDLRLSFPLPILVAYPMDSLPGPHKAQEERLLRPKASSPGRHSTESAPAAFENRTPQIHPRVAFSEAGGLQVDLYHGTGKGRADNTERPHQSLKECKCQQHLQARLRIFNECCCISTYSSTFLSFS